MIESKLDSSPINIELVSNSDSKILNSLTRESPRFYIYNFNSELHIYIIFYYLLKNYYFIHFFKNKIIIFLNLSSGMILLEFEVKFELKF